MRTSRTQVEEGCWRWEPGLRPFLSGGWWRTWVGILGPLRKAISVTLDAEPSASAGTSSCEDAQWLQPGTALAQAFKGCLTSRLFYQRSTNFLYGLQLHRDYRNQNDFSTWAGKDHGHVSLQGQAPGWGGAMAASWQRFAGKALCMYFCGVIWRFHCGA